MEPDELAALVAESERACRPSATIHYGPTDAEKTSLCLRRSVYSARVVQAGEVLTSDNLGIIRADYGLAPKYNETLLGLRVSRNLSMGTAMRWDYIG